MSARFNIEISEENHHGAATEAACTEGENKWA